MELAIFSIALLLIAAVWIAVEKQRSRQSKHREPQTSDKG